MKLVSILLLISLFGCASPYFELDMGLYRSTPVRRELPEIARLSIPYLPLTPDQIKALLQGFIPVQNDVEILFLKIKTKSTEKSILERE